MICALGLSTDFCWHQYWTTIDCLLQLSYLLVYTLYLILQLTSVTLYVDPTLILCLNTLCSVLLQINIWSWVQQWRLWSTFALINHIKIETFCKLWWISTLLCVPLKLNSLLSQFFNWTMQMMTISYDMSAHWVMIRWLFEVLNW